MKKLRAIAKRISALFNRDKHDADLAAELESHLQFHIEDNLRAGMSPEEARRQALIKLGGLDQTKESVRARRSLRWLDSLLQDARFALRMLRKNPGFTTVAILTLALGIGANTAIFSVIESVVLHPLPYRDPGKLVMLWEKNVGRDSGNKKASGPDVIDWRQENHVFEDMAFWPGWSGSEDFNLVGADGVEKVAGSYVSSHLFPVLGARPYLGRAFLPEEDRHHGNPAALVSYELWQRRFASDPNVLGCSITIDSYGRKDYTIVGVMPAGFAFPDQSELWLPAGWIDVPLDQRRSGHWYSVIARLRPGVTVDQAASEMNVIQAHIAQDHANEVVGNQVAVVPLLDQTLGTALRPALFALWGVVGFVLLIASANLSSLLLARNSARQKELALRMAIGASRARIVRQLLTESALLALTGGTVGIFGAYEAVRLFVIIAGDHIPRLVDTSVDAPSLAFTLAVSLMTGLVCGAGPASHLSHPHLNESLKSDSRADGTLLRGNRLRSWLVVGEIAASLVLLAGAGLMTRSFVALLQIDRGFRPDHLLTADLDFSVSGFSGWMNPAPTRPQVTLQRLIARLRQYPGVDSVAAASRLPRDLGNAPTSSIVIESHPSSPDSRPMADFEGVTPDYFKTMGIRLLQGRVFNEDDTLEAPLVVVVNSALAERYFPGENSIGKRMAFSSQNDPDQPNTFRGKTQWMQIVGVVSNVGSLSISRHCYAIMWWASTAYRR